MRQAGTLPSQTEAQRFVDFLFTEGIRAQAEQVDGAWAIWIRDEEYVDDARRRLDEFRANPTDARFRGASEQAQAQRKAEFARHMETRRRTVAMGDRWQEPVGRRAPITMILIGISIVVGLATNFGRGHPNPNLSRLLFLDFAQASQDRQWIETRDTVAGKLWSIRRGEVWRLVTPIFIHYGVVHLVFNMLMTYQLGTLIESRIGAWRFALLVLLVALLSVPLSALAPFDLTYPFPPANRTGIGGMSGVVFGLIGFLWARSRNGSFGGLMINPNLFLLAMAWIAVGVVGLLDMVFGAKIDNWGHALGLAIGYLVGLAMPRDD